MNIISGTKKGHKIISPNTKFRPTQSKVRSAFFNTVNMEGKSFLDLCSGSGAMSLEALSRGASNVVSVDIERLSIKAIFENYKKIFPENENYIIKRMSLDDFVKRTKDKYDVIFIDPPYFSNLYEKTIKIIFEKELLNENGIIVAEMAIEYLSKTTFHKKYNHEIRRYGTTILLFINDK